MSVAGLVAQMVKTKEMGGKRNHLRAELQGGHLYDGVVLQEQVP